MENDFDTALEKILNVDLDKYQKQFDKVKRINVEETLAKLESAGKADSDFYNSLSAIKDIDFDEYQKSLDAVKSMGLGINKDIPKIYSQMDDIGISQKKSIFISYSHQDSKHLDRLKVHLKPLEKKGLIELWDDTKIKTGDLWREQISTAIAKSTIAILIISADFLASDFIIDNELPPLLEKARLEGTEILPVILKASRIEREKSLSQFQALNSPKDPVLNMSENDQEMLWNKLSERIEELL